MKLPTIAWAREHFQYVCKSRIRIAVKLVPLNYGG